jgi:hypothetical protein
MKVEAWPFATLLRSVCDLVRQMAGLMIAAELAQWRFVELKENLAQFLGRGITGGKTLLGHLPDFAEQARINLRSFPAKRSLKVPSARLCS